MKKRKQCVWRYQYWGLVFISPWILGFLIFQLYPLASSLYTSFTNNHVLRGGHWVGLDNYIRLFTRDRDFFPTVYTTIKYVLMCVPAKLAFALVVALLMNIKSRGIACMRTVYYLPSIFGGSVAISILWRFLFMRTGLVNSLIGMLGIPAVDWLGSTKTALFTVSLVTVWQFGSSMVLFLAGLKQIPSELYESARIDGAGAVRRFASITLPALSPVIFFNLIMQMINAFQEFTLPFVITDGGPANSTYLYSMMIYENGFKFLKSGYASAQSWIMFLAIMAITALIFKSSPYWVFYNDGDA